MGPSTPELKLSGLQAKRWKEGEKYLPFIGSKSLARVLGGAGVMGGTMLPSFQLVVRRLNKYIENKGILVFHCRIKELVLRKWKC